MKGNQNFCQYKSTSPIKDEKISLIDEKEFQKPKINHFMSKYPFINENNSFLNNNNFNNGENNFNNIMPIRSESPQFYNENNNLNNQLNDTLKELSKKNESLISEKVDLAKKMMN